MNHDLTRIARKIEEGLGVSPTAEQLDVLDQIRHGESIKINAYAGTGKTTTLVMLGYCASLPMLYLAFNRHVIPAAEADFEQADNNVLCRTIHGVAFRQLVQRFGAEMLNRRPNAQDLQRDVGFNDFVRGDLSLDRLQLATLALKVVQRFCHSRHDSLKMISMPRLGAINNMSASDVKALEQYVSEIAEQCWLAMQDPRAHLGLGHDGYLKLWALGKPRLPRPVVLLDEAQDTNEVVLKVLEDQQRNERKLIYVGDRHQQIYEWRGAVNALEKVNTASSLSLTKSFRFGAAIASLANRILAKLGDDTQIIGNERVHSYVGEVSEPEVIIARKNATVLCEVMNALRLNQNPYVEGGIDDIKTLLGGVYDLKRNGRTKVEEFLGFTSWEEVVEFARTEFGQELQTIVQLVSEHGVDRLWAVLSQVQPNALAGTLTISTAHKAKGREWSKVRLADDFVIPEKDADGKTKSIPAEEVRILYVAATRAKNALQLGEKTVQFLDL